MSLEQLGLAIDTDAELSPPAHHVLMVLCWHASELGRAWPSVGTLARITRLGRRTVQRAVTDLRAAGLATIVSESQGKVAAVYQLTIPAPLRHPSPGVTAAQRHNGTCVTATPEGRHSGAEGRHTDAKGRQSGAQSVMIRHEPQNAGGRAREGAPALNGRGATAAPLAPPANLTNSAPRFEPSPEHTARADALRAELARRRSAAPDPDATPPADPARRV